MYFKEILLILLLANVALAISCRDRDKDKIDEGKGFFLRKAEIDCKREQECFPDLFQILSNEAARYLIWPEILNYFSRNNQLPRSVS